MIEDILNSSEIDYFNNLHKKYGITYISVDEEGVTFKEEELPNFLNSSEAPEVGLEKMLNLNKITKEIFQKINFNYSIEYINGKANIVFSD